MANHIFQTCYNLCRLNKSRQEEAAQAGIVPCLKRVIQTQSPLKQFALPILCDLAGAGKSCRTLLWQHDGIGMYVQLLEDPYFQVSALESILSWLQDETARVEDQLLKRGSVDAILKCFVTAKTISFENLLDPFFKMLRLSVSLTIALTKTSSGAFLKRIVERLGQHTKAVVRLNLLRILRYVCEVHPNRAVLVEKYGLLHVVEKLSKTGGDGAVLVRELARDIVPVLRPALRPATSLNLSSSSSSYNSIGSSAGDSSRLDARQLRRSPRSDIMNMHSHSKSFSGSGGERGQLKPSGIAPRKYSRRSASDQTAIAIADANQTPLTESTDSVFGPSSSRSKEGGSRLGLTGTGTGTGQGKVRSGSAGSSRQRLGDLWNNTSSSSQAGRWQG